MGSRHKRQKPQAPIRNRQTRKVTNAKGLNRNTNLTLPNLTKPKLYELWRLRLFSFGGYGLALAALALVVFGARMPPSDTRLGDTPAERYRSVALLTFRSTYPIVTT